MSDQRQLEVTLTSDEWVDILNVLQVCAQDTARSKDKDMKPVNLRIVALRNKISKQVAMEVKFSG